MDVQRAKVMCYGCRLWKWILAIPGSANERTVKLCPLLFMDKEKQDQKRYIRRYIGIFLQLINRLYLINAQNNTCSHLLNTIK